MNEPAKKIPTYEDILAAPEHVVAEIVDGELTMMPRPAPQHAVAASNLHGDLNAMFTSRRRGGPGGWWILIEPELHLEDSDAGRGLQVTVPDLAGWCRERMAALPTEAFFTLAPDWVCEVVSPSTARLDRVKKLPHYARAGVAHAWVLDPLNRTLEVYRREGSRWMLASAFGGDDKVRAEPFEAVEIDLAFLWAPEPLAR